MICSMSCKEFWYCTYSVLGKECPFQKRESELIICPGCNHVVNKEGKCPIKCNKKGMII